MDKIVVVTGSKGFIGKRLCEKLLESGYQVRKIDIPEFDLSLSHPTGDSIKNYFADVDIVYHLAAMNLVRCNDYPVDCVRNNIIATLNLLKICQEYNIKRLVYSSASSVYGQPKTDVVGEEHPTNPLTLYGASKLAAEKMIYVYIKQSDLKSIIFRFTNVYGPGQVNGLIPVTIRNILNNKTIQISGNGTQTRDFVYVDDVVDYLMLAIDRPIYSYTMNLGSGISISVLDILSMISTVLGEKSEIEYQPFSVDRSAFRANLHKLNTVYPGKNYISLWNGLKNTIEWVKKNDK